MSFEMDPQRIAENTAKKIKRQLNYYLRALKGRHKRLLGGLGGIPITPELAEADTNIEWMATHPNIPDNLRRELVALKQEIVEPFEDLYFDGLISVDDILYGKQRPTQHEVIDISGGSDEFDKALEGEENEQE